jgi:hypothetical protein
MKVQVNEKGWELLGEAHLEPNAEASASEPAAERKSSHVPSSGVYPKAEEHPAAVGGVAPLSEEELAGPTEPAPPSLEALAEALPAPPRVPLDLALAADDPTHVR